MDVNLNDIIFKSVASLPIFLSINTEGVTKEQIVQNLIKENLDSIKYQNQTDNNNSESVNMDYNLHIFFIYMKWSDMLYWDLSLLTYITKVVKRL